MPNRRLPTNFQLNIFKFVARVSRVSLQNLLQSLKQTDSKSAQIGNVPKYPSISGDYMDNEAFISF